MMSKVLGVILTIAGAHLIPFGISFFRGNLPVWVLPTIGIIVLIMGIVLTTSGEREDFRPDTKVLKIADHHPCPVCGKENYTWGFVSGPQAARFRTKVVGIIGTGKPILARTCDNCGHLNLFIKPDQPFK